MSRDKTEEEKTEKLLKRWRRARGGRTLPRSGQGVHEDKKSKKIEDQIEEDYDDEIRMYITGHDDDYDIDKEIAVSEEEEREWREYQEKLKKEKEDASTS